MEPRIQYAKTSDGVNIAYAVLGSGPPIVFAGSLWGDLQQYQTGIYASPISVNDALISRGWSVIRYDGRGMGSSDRDIEDFTVESKLRDLEAVIERTAPGQFVLWGSVAGGPAAIAHTAANPNRVRQLVLNNTYAVGADWYSLVPGMRISQQTLSDAASDWEFHLLTLANAVTGYEQPDLAGRLAASWKTAMTPGDYMAFRLAAEKIDVRHFLSQISVPTLVMHDTSLLTRMGEVTRRLAPLIPNARFVETDDVARVADEFLREHGLVPTLPAEMSELSVPGGVPSTGTTGMTAILFADIADSTALTERMGDAAFRGKARDLDGALRAAIWGRGGTPVEGKLLGDGVLAVFTSAREAIEAALSCGEAGKHAGLPLHLGIHAGDVIREENNVYGGAVNIASRIAGLSAAGEVLVSETVRSLARTSAGVRFEDRGEQALKGVGEKVRVWRVVANKKTGKQANKGV